MYKAAHGAVAECDVPLIMAKADYSFILRVKWDICEGEVPLYVEQEYPVVGVQGGHCGDEWHVCYIPSLRNSSNSERYYLSRSLLFQTILKQQLVYAVNHHPERTKAQALDYTRMLHGL